MPEFRRVGGEIPYGETSIRLEDAEPIRRIASQGLLLAAAQTKIAWNEEQDSIRYAQYFDSEFSEGVSDRFLVVQMINSREPDYWRLGVSMRTLKDSDRHSNKRIHFRLEGAQGELLQAKKEVYLIIGLARVAIVNGEPVEQVVTDRKVFERPMLALDCERVCTMLSNAQKRLEAVA